MGACCDPTAGATTYVEPVSTTMERTPKQSDARSHHLVFQYNFPSLPSPTVYVTNVMKRGLYHRTAYCTGRVESTAIGLDMAAIQERPRWNRNTNKMSKKRSASEEETETKMDEETGGSPSVAKKPRTGDAELKELWKMPDGRVVSMLTLSDGTVADERDPTKTVKVRLCEKCPRQPSSWKLLNTDNFSISGRGGAVFRHKCKDCLRNEKSNPSFSKDHVNRITELHRVVSKSMVPYQAPPRAKPSTPQPVASVPVAAAVVPPELKIAPRMIEMEFETRLRNRSFEIATAIKAENDACDKLKEKLKSIAAVKAEKLALETAKTARANLLRDIEAAVLDL